MNSDSRVTYWLKGQTPQNFGDALSEILFDALTQNSLLNWRQGRLVGNYDVIHLIGSCISDWHILKDLEYCRADSQRRIAFWGCGLRNGEPLSRDLAKRCVFLAVRGPLTCKALGLGADVPIGDPGLLMPYLYIPRPSAAFVDRSICVPHFLEKKSDEELLALSGCDCILRPNIHGSMESILTFVDALTSANFVLTGALHGAIVAHAYRRPFAFFDSGYIDVPFKWEDFASSIDMPIHFVQTQEIGLRFYRANSNRLTMPRLGVLLACAPYRASRSLMRRILR